MTQPYRLAKNATLEVQDNSTQYQISGSTGLLYSQGRPVYMPDSTAAYDHYVETVALTSGGATPSTITPYGITIVNPNTTGGDFSSSPRGITMGLPIPGVSKTIVFNTTGAAVNTLTVILTTNAGVQSASGSSDGFIQFSSLATLPQAINLVGVSTSVWQVTSVESTIPGFGGSTGIRNVNAQETS